MGVVGSKNMKNREFLGICLYVIREKHTFAFGFTD